MSTPPSADNLTPNENITFDNIKSFDIKVDNIMFILKISYNDKLLLFETEKKDQFPKELYLKYLDMEDLGKINRFFLQFETPADAIDSLALLIKSNNVSIIEENKQMKIQITNPSIQKQFSIEIPKKEKDLKAELDAITPYIKSLHEKIDNLENQLKEKTNSLEKKIYELMSIKKEYETLKIKEILQNNRFFKGSNIIKIDDEVFILNWLEKKPMKFVKLLDSKVDGDSTDAFINKCANKCPTIVFVKTTKGFRFGGFTSEIWRYGKYGYDSKCFLFSLDRKEKYIITTCKYATYYDSYYFYFGDAALYLYNNCTSYHNNYVSDSSFKTVPANNGINGGDEYFTVSSYEVYQLKY